MVRRLFDVDADRLLVLLLLASALERGSGDGGPGLVEYLLALQLLGLNGHLAVALLFVFVELGGLFGLQARTLSGDGGLKACTAGGGRLGLDRLCGRLRSSLCGGLLGDRSRFDDSGCRRYDNGRYLAGDHRLASGLLGSEARGLLVAQAVLLVAALALLESSLVCGLLGSLVRGLLGSLRLGGFSGLELGPLLFERDLALGDLRSERLADLVHVRLDQCGSVVLSRYLEILELVEQLLARHTELFGEFMHPH